MYDAPYYFLAMLLAVAGVYITANRPRWDGFVVGSLCVCGCLGIYQAYFPVAVCLFVILLIMEIARDRHASFAKAMMRGLYFLSVCVAGLILFFVIWKLVMRATGIAPDNYQGVSSIGQSGMNAYIGALKKSYERFLLRFANRGEDLYPMKLAWVQGLIIAASGIGGLCMVFLHFRRDRAQTVLMALLLAILPICFNLIYMMAASSPSDEVDIHSLTLYGQCMLYVFLIVCVNFLWESGGKLKPVFCRAAVAALTLMVCMNVYFDNSCYLKAEMEMQQAISDMTTLVTRIKSVEGYKDTMRVCLTRYGKKDATVSKNPEFDDIALMPFDNVYPSHNLRRYAVDYLKRWCGFAPKYTPLRNFEDLEEYQQMPDYPDDGSVKIINGAVVVKW